MHVAIILVALGGKIVKFSVRIKTLQLRKTVVIVNCDVFPIVQACSFEHLVAGVKAQRAYQVQNAVCRCTTACNVSRVGGNFRFYQYNMYHDL